jgi:hypothetical protein
MKFKNRAVNISWIVLLCWTSTLYALNNANYEAKTTVYPSVLYPGKVWVVSPSSENTSQSNNIWQNTDVNTTRYRPLTDPQTADVRSETGDCCVPNPAGRTRPPVATSDTPRYRGELYEEVSEMPRYRSEFVDEPYQDDNRYPQHRSPRQKRDNLSPQFSQDYWQSHSDRIYDDMLPAAPYARQAWDLMNDPFVLKDPSGEFSVSPPLNPNDWNPYIRNNYSSQNTPTSPQIQPQVQQIPLKNVRPLPSAELTISADWIPAPPSALVDSEEFRPNYATTPVPLRPHDENIAIGAPTKP